MTPIRLFILCTYVCTNIKAFGFLVASKQPRSILVLSLIGLGPLAVQHKREPNLLFRASWGAPSTDLVIIGPPLKSPHVANVAKDRVLVWREGPPFSQLVVFGKRRPKKKKGLGRVPSVILNINETKHIFPSCCRPSACK